MGSVSLILKLATGHNHESVPFTSKIHLKVIFAVPTLSSKLLLSKMLPEIIFPNQSLYLAHKVPKICSILNGHTGFRSVLKMLIYESNISSHRSSIDTSKKIGLCTNAEKTKFMLICQHSVI
jgi:hypothetical protein